MEILKSVLFFVLMLSAFTNGGAILLGSLISSAIFCGIIGSDIANFLNIQFEIFYTISTICFFVFYFKIVQHNINKSQLNTVLINEKSR